MDFIVSDPLHSHPSGRPKRIFEKHRDTFNGCRKVIINSPESSIPYLTIAIMVNYECCDLVRKHISDDAVFQGADLDHPAGKTCDRLGRDTLMKNQIVSALNKVGLNITDFSFIKSKTDPDPFRDTSSDDLIDTVKNDSSIHITHNHAECDVESEERTFDLDIEIRGTQTMFGPIGPLVESIRSGKTPIIYGFEAFLHPIITRWIASQLSRGGRWR